MKKIQKLLITAIALLSFSIANAIEIVDVTNNYWASQEIVRAIQNGYIYIVDGNKFVPEGSITRADFVTALLKVIRRENEPVIQDTKFKDINSATPNKKSIILSEQIRMAFGYPDLTFKPNVAINHNETMSMIANITKSDYQAGDITIFKDYNKIPIWAMRAYIKNVANDLYVNHPDELSFTPSKNLTRAEAAVLFDKVASNIDKVQDKYRDLYNNLSDELNGKGYKKAEFQGTEELNLVPFAQNNKVDIYDTKLVIEAGNILIGTAQNQLKAREDLVGQEFVFTAPNDVFTTQGTLLYPKGTEFYARVNKLGYSSWRSKAEKSNVVFYKYSLPSGETYDMAGVPYTHKEKVVYADNLKPKKVEALTLKENDSKYKLIECAHQMSPVLDYDIKNLKTIYILLTGDMVIPQNDEYYNLRTKKSILEERI